MVSKSISIISSISAKSVYCEHGPSCVFNSMIHASNHQNYGECCSILEHVDCAKLKSNTTLRIHHEIVKRKVSWKITIENIQKIINVFCDGIGVDALKIDTDRNISFLISLYGSSGEDHSDSCFVDRHPDNESEVVPSPDSLQNVNACIRKVEDNYPSMLINKSTEKLRRDKVIRKINAEKNSSK